MTRRTLQGTQLFKQMVCVSPYAARWMFRTKQPTQEMHRTHTVPLESLHTVGSFMGRFPVHSLCVERVQLDDNIWSAYCTPPALSVANHRSQTVGHGARHGFLTLNFTVVMYWRLIY